jgi:hypothetical protein
MQLVECPLIYKMLPNLDFNWKKKPIIQVWRKNPEKDGTVELVQYEATGCVSFFEEALRNNDVEFFLGSVVSDTIVNTYIINLKLLCYQS